MSQSDTELEKIVSELKTLEIEKRKKMKHIDNIKHTLSEAEHELANVHMRINQIKSRIRDPIVTEHAILRYLQRVEGKSLTEVIKTILPDQLAKTVKVLGSGVYPVGEKFKIVVKDGIVVTVIGFEEEHEAEGDK